MNDKGKKYHCCRTNDPTKLSYGPCQGQHSWSYHRCDYVWCCGPKCPCRISNTTVLCLENQSSWKCFAGWKTQLITCSLQAAIIIEALRVTFSWIYCFSLPMNFSGFYIYLQVMPLIARLINLQEKQGQIVRVRKLKGCWWDSPVANLNIAWGYRDISKSWWQGSTSGQHVCCD